MRTNNFKKLFMLTYYGKAILTENFSYFCSINVLNFSHKLTLKTVNNNNNNNNKIIIIHPRDH